MRPLRELDLGDELRLDPDDVALLHLRHLRDDRERRRVLPQRLELFEQLGDGALAEAGADVSDPLPLLAATHAEDEGAEAAAATALTLRVAADHELLPPVGLDLEPVAAAPSLRVARRRALRHHAFEALLLGRFEQCLSVLKRARELDDRVPREQLLELSPSLDEWQVDERLTVDLEDVEHLVRESCAPLLHRGEAGLAARIERDDLSVDYGIRSAKRLRQLLARPTRTSR